VSLVVVVAAAGAAQSDARRSSASGRCCPVVVAAAAVPAAAAARAELEAEVAAARLESTSQPAPASGSAARCGSMQATVVTVELEGKAEPPGPAAWVLPVAPWPAISCHNSHLMRPEFFPHARRPGVPVATAPEVARAGTEAEVPAGHRSVWSCKEEPLWKPMPISGWSWSKWARRDWTVMDGGPHRLYRFSPSDGTESSVMDGS